MDRKTDFELVKLFYESKNKRFFDTLLQRHTRTIMKQLFGHINIKENREDVFQEILIAIYQQLACKKFKFESKFSTWISQIAVYKRIDFLKNRNKEISTRSWDVSEYLNVIKIPFSDYDTTHDERMILVQSALRKMDSFSSSTLLHILEGVDKKEFIEKNNIKDNVYRARKLRAIKEVQRMIAHAS